MKLKRLMFAIGIAFAFATASMAQTYPNRLIRFIAPFAPGGGADTVSRMLAQKLTENLGQQVVVDNRPGAGGAVGTALAAKSPPDGYTLLLATSAALSVNPNLRRDLPYDPLRDFAPISLVASFPNVLAVHPSLPVRSVREVIGLAKAHPEKLTFSSSGIGGSGHLAGEMFNVMAGVKMVHVPYRGTAPAALAVLSGEVTLSFGNILALLPHVKGGRLRGIAVTSAKRSPAAPDLPTVSEAGVSGFEAGPWHGVVAPAGTPKEIITRLSGELAKIMNNPDVRKQLSAEGGEVVDSSPEQLAEHMKVELKRWAKIIKEANIRAD
ncbi:MAG: tripartite tricarboxylate transporter substrate binding protein [Betaproteobacteria bacterium]|nr:tripartite tricarboxylate transporter substrate binding protein [Betaproteobacteria bacterium]